MIKRIIGMCLLLSMLMLVYPYTASADVFKDNLPKVSSNSYVVLDGDTGEVLFGKDYDKEFDPSVMAQMMTAILIIERSGLSDEVKAPEMPGSINSGNTVYIRKNESFRMGDLLEAIILYNANDAAYAAAVHVGGSVENFVKLMNEEAKKLKMDHTEFKSPYGKAEGQKTTPRDMALLAAKASSLEKYVEYTLKPKMNWNGEMFAQENIPNVNGFPRIMKDGIGIKLAERKEDKKNIFNLAASLTKNGRTIVSVFCNEDDEVTLYKDSAEALNFGMKNSKSMKLIKKGTAITVLNFGTNKSVKAVPDRDLSITVGTDTSSDIRTETNLTKSERPIKKGDQIGSIDVYSGENKVDSINLIADGSVSKGINWLMVLLFILSALFIISVILRWYYQIRRRSKKGGRVPKAIGGNVMSRTVKKSKSLMKQQKQPPKKTTKKITSHSNPSVGSSEGRKALEQKLQEKKYQRNTYTINREHPGDRR